MTDLATGDVTKVQNANLSGVPSKPVSTEQVPVVIPGNQKAPTNADMAMAIAATMGNSFLQRPTGSGLSGGGKSSPGNSSKVKKAKRKQVKTSKRNNRKKK